MNEWRHSDGPFDAVLEESAEDLYEHAPCGYISALPDGTIVRVNQTFLDWTGHAREAVIDTRFQRLLAIGSRIYYETHYAPLLRMQGEVREIALDVQRADGSTLPVLVNARHRVDGSGTPLFARLTLFNATDRRRYEQELLLARRKAERAANDNRELIAMLSHDIRNPLNALMGYVTLLERGELTDTQRRYTQVLRTSAESMLGLLNRVLDMSRTESFSIVDKPFSVRDTIDSVLTTFQTRATEKGLTLSARVGTEVPPQVVGDPIATRQILSNLVGNAVKFTERGAVTVSVEARDDADGGVLLDFEVRDTGIGIPQDVIDRIFEEYTQAHEERSYREAGTGLGLAITRRLLGLYGSTIRVESEVDKGSRFFFTLRLQRA